METNSHLAPRDARCGEDRARSTRHTWRTDWLGVRQEAPVRVSEKRRQTENSEALRGECEEADVQRGRLLRLARMHSTPGKVMESN